MFFASVLHVYRTVYTDRRALHMLQLVENLPEFILFHGQLLHFIAEL